jgi:hypothetical protein
MERASRREFLKRTATAGVAAGAGIASAGLFPRRIPAQEKKKDVQLVYRQLGSTGYKVTEVGFGVMNTRDPELIQAGLDAGINWFDTAHGYMNGVNEEVLGRVLKNSRSKVYVATKVHCVGRGAKDIREMMETSLKRLQMDYVDIMFMHMPDHGKEIMVKEHMMVFEQAKKDGLCKFIGVSTHVNQAETVNTAVDSKFWEAVIVGYNYHSPKEVTAAMERARNAGLAVIAMKTQAKGRGFPNHKMGDISKQQAALKWVLQHPFVDTTIPGVTNFEQLAENVAVMGMKMSFFDRLDLNRHAGSLKGVYCRGVAGCTGCQNQCPMGVQICELNRCLGYAYGYGDLRLARENYAQLPASTRVERCGDCVECRVKCVNGLDLTESVRLARGLFA